MIYRLGVGNNISVAAHLPALSLYLRNGVERLQHFAMKTVRHGIGIRQFLELEKFGDLFFLVQFIELGQALFPCALRYYSFPEVIMFAAVLPDIQAGKVKPKNFYFEDKFIQKFEEQAVMVFYNSLSCFVEDFQQLIFGIQFFITPIKGMV